ncbi:MULTISPECIES: LysR family transcriptional regulator [unclassified Sphingobium]|uniref:LysR family transcriptional regulator n=1 Tax=unclassified Sphingobium TaxID=2611147 RepID=UPI0007F51650|nr:MULTISPECIES: LysR family transcriptional regulator [unclassified Sphingobium]OAN54832.1 LysR family transcriptional regulator [Sphingobium sp. TCM1]WIW90579.1 LysR family transcriptional regulator [Sphingobium sp. V4]
MRFRGLDLNLLAVFDGLMQTRSVSAAARQMNLSQPAMSAALSRLRDYFGDQLLVTHGKRMYPTAFAESLVPLVRESLGNIESLLATSVSFDPATSQRAFRIVASDYVVSAIISPLLARFAREAPGVTIHLITPGENSTQLIADGKADLMISPQEFLSPDHPSELLFEEEHVVAGWVENPLLHGELNEKLFLAAGHVAVVIGARFNASFADRTLISMGKVRRVEVSASSFATVPWLLTGTHRLAVMHERLAIAACRIFPIRTTPMPFPFPVMKEMVQFHQTRAADEGLKWLREQLRTASTNP